MDDIIDRAFKKAKELGGEQVDDISMLPTELQVVVLVVSAQGIIDNGGYEYFFEDDWPGQPDYEMFARAYAAIGCDQAAADLRHVVGTFPFPAPHLNKESRNEYIRTNFDEQNCCVRGWGDALCGDATIWSQLSKYCHERSAIIGI